MIRGHFSDSDSNQSPTPKLRDRLRSLTPYENIYTVPNILTFSRLISAPVVGYLVLHDQHALAIGLFAYAGVTDLIDGWIARRWNLQTVVGTVIDPMADKALMTIVTVCLAINGGMPGMSLVTVLALVQAPTNGDQNGLQESFWEETFYLRYLPSTTDTFHYLCPKPLPDTGTFPYQVLKCIQPASARSTQDYSLD